jgi:Lon-like ATP-dependent protease
LLKDSESDSDVITSIDQVHPVGVFAQITSVFGSTEPQATKDGEPAGEPKPETLTAVLYPHRRIRIDELITSAPPPAEAVPIAEVVDQIHEQETKEEVASFEKEVPSVDEVKGESCFLQRLVPLYSQRLTIRITQAAISDWLLAPITSSDLAHRH